MPCFGCFGGLARQREEKPLIIDVEQVIADAAWASFLASYGRCQRRFLKREKFRIEVPMNYYHFEQVGVTLFRTKKRPGGVTEAIEDPSTSKSLLEGKPLAHRDLTSPERMGLQTIFNNDTDKEQTYNFSFEKTRTSSVTVTYERGYSFGGKANFSLGLPKVLTDSSLGMEFETSVQVTKSTGETFEDSITTSANSEITVGSHSKYVASVVMEERNLLAEFELKMMMSMPAKRAPVYIHERSSGELAYAYCVNSLPDRFHSFSDVQKVRDADGNVMADAVVFHITGLVNGMQLSNHTINLTGRSLQPDGDAKGGAGEGDRDGGEKTP